MLGFFVAVVVDPGDPAWYLIGPFVLGSLLAGVAVLTTRFRHTCTYVGRDGVAQFTCSGDRGHLKSRSVFLFRDAVELRIAQTLQYVHGVYTGTSYSYDWNDAAGRVRHVIAGRHRSEKGNPPSTDPLHFARAAEVAWTGYLLDQVYGQIEETDTVPFNLADEQWLRLGRGFMILSDGGEEGRRWEAEEIAQVSVKQGNVRIKHRNAREGWFSSDGVFKFSFDKLPNSQLFVHLCGTLVGVPVG